MEFSNTTEYDRPAESAAGNIMQESPHDGGHAVLSAEQIKINVIQSMMAFPGILEC